MVEKNKLIKDTIESWTTRFAGTNQASVYAAKENEKKSAKFREKEFELKKEVAEIDAGKMLLSSNDGHSLRYREALQRKRLRKILGFQKESTN